MTDLRASLNRNQRLAAGLVIQAFLVSFAQVGNFQLRQSVQFNYVLNCEAFLALIEKSEHCPGVV